MGQVVCCQYFGKSVTINGANYSVEKTIGEGGKSLNKARFTFDITYFLSFLDKM